MSNAFKALVKSLIAVVLLVLNASGLRSQTPGHEKLRPSSRDKQRLARFEKQADELRKLLKIPGMSAVIVKDQKVLWAKGFGFADLENRTPATPDTVYHIASLTKTFAATLLMQLVEQGKLDLDEPMSHYSGDFKDDSVKIKHLLSHTSAGTLGDHHFPAIVDLQGPFQGGAAITNNVFACNFLRLFLFEDVKGGRQSKGYPDDCERNSQTAVAKWIEHRRGQARVAIQLDPGILERYVGQYQFEAPSTRVLTVSREGGRLFVNIPGNNKSELFAESESKFFLKVRPVQLRFIKEDGQVAYLEHVFANMEPSRAKRVK